MQANSASELDRDNPDLRSARLELWETFNRCWLTTLQRQLDMTRDMFSRGGQQPAAPLSLLTAYMMETLGQQLVQLCDGIEKMGLVDYQMGVAEEEILDCKSCFYGTVGMAVADGCFTQYLSSVWISCSLNRQIHHDSRVGVLSFPLCILS